MSTRGAQLGYRVLLASAIPKSKSDGAESGQATFERRRICRTTVEVAEKVRECVFQREQ